MSQKTSEEERIAFLELKLEACISDVNFYRLLWLSALDKTSLDVVATAEGKVTLETKTNLD